MEISLYKIEEDSLLESVFSVYMRNIVPTTTAPGSHQQPLTHWKDRKTGQRRKTFVARNLCQGDGKFHRYMHSNIFFCTTYTTSMMFKRSRGKNLLKNLVMVPCILLHLLMGILDNLRGLARYGHHMVATALKKVQRQNLNMLTPPNQAQ